MAAPCPWSRPAPRSRWTWSTTYSAGRTQSGSDHRGRARRGSGRAIRRPERRAAKSASRSARDQPDPARAGTPDADHQAGRGRRRHGRGRAGAQQARLSRFVREAGGTAAIAATRRTELARAFHSLPEFLGELDPYMLRLGQLATAQRPVLRDLRGASGQLDTFLDPASALRRGGRPGRSRRWGRPRSSAAAPCAAPTRSSRCFAALLRRRPASPSHSGSSFRRPTIAGGPWSRIAGRPQPTRPLPTRRTYGRGRLHRDGGVLELLLLADALNQLAGRHRSHPAAQRGPPGCSGSSRPRRRPGRLRSLPQLARSPPAGGERPGSDPGAAPAAAAAAGPGADAIPVSTDAALPASEPVLDYLLGP